MTNNIQVFNYEAYQIRTVNHNNSIWFVAKDVCEVLGFANSRDAISKHVDDDERDDVAIRDTIGRNQSMTVINESGLYTLILRSNKPNAKAFRKWVTAEVLPSIRENGFYATPDTAQRILDDPDNKKDVQILDNHSGSTRKAVIMQQTQRLQLRQITLLTA